MTILEWNTATEWDAGTDDGTVHESVTNTDHDNAAIVKQGYQIASPFNSTTLVGYYPLHEDSGTTAYDFSGNNYDASTTGATVNQTGLLGTTGYDFDGTDDHVQTPTNADLDAPRTILAWIKPSSLAANTYANTVVNNDDTTTAGDDDVNIIRLGSDGGSVRIRDSTDTTGAAAFGSTFSTGTWYQVGMTYASDGTLISYLDGTAKNTDSTADGSFMSADVGQTFGARVNDTSFDRFFAGIITDVRFYSDVLTSTEIQTLYDVVRTNGLHTTSTKTS